VLIGAAGSRGLLGCVGPEQVVQAEPAGGMLGDQVRGSELTQELAFSARS
jgi:hypothetical protein